MSEKKIDYISPEQAVTLYGLFQQRVNRTPDAPAYKSYSTQTNSWYDINWREVAEQVSRWQKALAEEHLQPGDRVALNLRNCKEWVFFDQAAMGLGLVLVPLYPDDRPDSVAYILQDADIKLLLLRNLAQWKRLKPALTDEHHLQKVVIHNPDDEALDSGVAYLQDWLPPNGDGLNEWQGETHQLASIIYTSGTTGRPKGVMLSHHNMLSVAAGALTHFNIYPDDLFLSFLPLSHTLERTAGYYLPMMAGATIAYSRGIPQLPDDLIQLQPSILIAVPRIFERIHTRINQQLAKKPIINRLLFKLTVDIGWSYFNYQQGRKGWRPWFFLRPLLNKLVSAKIQQLMGGNLRLAISGGAALCLSSAKLFISLGFELLQGYGLTETSPVISVNKPDQNDPASVGSSLPNVNVKIGENDELLVKGPGNMLGYWNNHKATSQVIDADGWLHTGDQAHISDTGHIYITGRIKDILVMSNGEKVPPSDIEAVILMDNLFDQALVLGEGKSYLTAILVLNQEKWFSLTKRFQLDAMTPESLQDKHLHQFIIKQLKTILHDFPAYAKIRRVTLTLEPWTIENGLLTPTLKLKRVKVIEAYMSQIEAMYNN